MGYHSAGGVEISGWHAEIHTEEAGGEAGDSAGATAPQKTGLSVAPGGMDAGSLQSAILAFYWNLVRCSVVISNRRPCAHSLMNTFVDGVIDRVCCGACWCWNSGTGILWKL